uniref:Peptidase A1 domain-containing protein n=2 Tax=Bursaphelenchus xylophilus TaxID=6326 RepID=A0A1I7RXU2_BURXY
MRFLSVCFLVLAATIGSAVEYNSDDGIITVAIGEKEVTNVKLGLVFQRDTFVVFGPACKDANTCTKQQHAVYDPTKDSKEVSENGTLGPFEYLRYDDVQVALGDVKSAHTVTVLTGLKEGGEIADIPADGFLGLGIAEGENSTFSKLVSANGKSSYLLIVGGNPKTKSPNGKIVIGEEDNVACGTFVSVNTETSTDWAFKAKATFEKDPIDVTVDFAFRNVAFSRNITERFYDSINITQKDYDELKDVTIQVKDITVTITKDLLYKKVGDDYQRQFFTTSDSDIEVPGKVLNNYCVRLEKDGSTYSVGVAERKNSVGVIMASLGMISFMLSLLRL